MNYLALPVIALLILGTGFFSGTASAANNFPTLLYRNQNPVYTQFATMLPRPVTPLTKGTIEWSLTNLYSNIFEDFATTDYTVRLDMEMLRSIMEISYGLGKGFTFSMDLPLVNTNPGFLDPFVQWYHNLIGVPNGGRQRVANNSFTFNVTNRVDGSNLYDVAKVTAGIGDLSLWLRHEIVTEAPGKPGLGWFTMLELPTGRRTRGLGNGALDYGFGILLEKSRGRWHGHTNIGYFMNGGHAELDNLLHNYHVGWLVGGVVDISRPVSIHAQIHGGTPILKGMGEKRWDHLPLDLIIGFSGTHPSSFGDHVYFWKIAFSEDIYPNGPSIDFTAVAQLGVSWDKL